MLFLFWILLLIVSACLLMLMPLLLGRETYNRYRGTRVVTCPENQQKVVVSFRALRAALSGLSGRPLLRLAECTRWPAKQDCAQDCIPEAARVSPYRGGEVPTSKTKKEIYHLPIVIGAFVAWILGAIWHSQFVFRSQWMQSLGLSSSEFRQIVWWRTPHLLSAAVPLLFAYGVAWLLAVNHKKGVLWGMVSALALWLAVAAGGFAGARSSGISGDLVMMEITYTFVASLVIGAIIGGLQGKLVEERFADRRG